MHCMQPMVRRARKVLPVHKALKVRKARWVLPVKPVPKVRAVLMVRSGAKVQQVRKALPVWMALSVRKVLPERVSRSLGRSLIQQIFLPAPSLGMPIW